MCKGKERHCGCLYYSKPFQATGEMPPDQFPYQPNYLNKMPQAVFPEWQMHSDKHRVDRFHLISSPQGRNKNKDHDTCLQQQSC